MGFHKYTAHNTDNKGKLFVMLFADSEPFAGISLNLKPGYAHLQVIKLFYTKTNSGSGIVYTATLRRWPFANSVYLDKYTST